MGDTQSKPSLDERRRAWREAIIGLLVVIVVVYPRALTRVIDAVGMSLSSHFSELDGPGGVKAVMRDVSTATQGIQDVQASLTALAAQQPTDSVIRQQIEKMAGALGGTEQTLAGANVANKSILVNAKQDSADTGWIYLGLVDPKVTHWLGTSTQIRNVDVSTPDIKPGQVLQVVDDVYLHDDAADPPDPNVVGFRAAQKVIGVVRDHARVTVDRKPESSPTAAGNTALWAHIKTDSP